MDNRLSDYPGPRNQCRHSRNSENTGFILQDWSKNQKITNYMTYWRFTHFYVIQCFYILKDLLYSGENNNKTTTMGSINTRSNRKTQGVATLLTNVPPPTHPLHPTGALLDREPTLYISLSFSLYLSLQIKNNFSSAIQIPPDTFLQTPRGSRTPGWEHLIYVEISIILVLANTIYTRTNINIYGGAFKWLSHIGSKQRP